MTFRMATPEETKALFGKPLIFFGVKPPASSGTTSTSTAAETPEAVSQFLPWRPMAPDPAEGLEQEIYARFGPPTTSSTAPAPREYTEADREILKALGFD